MRHLGFRGVDIRFFSKRGGFMSGTQTTYNDKVVRQFAVMTVIWGIVGMLVGVIIAGL